MINGYVLYIMKKNEKIKERCRKDGWSMFRRNKNVSVFGIPNLVGKGPISFKTRYFICMSGDVALFPFDFEPGGWIFCHFRLVSM